MYSSQWDCPIGIDHGILEGFQIQLLTTLAETKSTEHDRYRFTGLGQNFDRENDIAERQDGEEHGPQIEQAYEAKTGPRQWCNGLLLDAPENVGNDDRNGTGYQNEGEFMKLVG